MRALRVPYPFPRTLPNYADLQYFSDTGRIVDFPERHISYFIYDCNQTDVEQAFQEVLKAVGASRKGEEPDRLELRSTQL